MPYIIRPASTVHELNLLAHVNELIGSPTAYPISGDAIALEADNILCQSISKRN